MNYMMTSGSSGRANLECALDIYRTRLIGKLGAVEGKALIKSTAGMDPIKRLWELERIYAAPKGAS